MKKILLSSLVCLSLLAACNQKPAGILDLSDALKANQDVVAKVAGIEVYESELASYAKSRTQQEFSEMNIEVQKNLFNEFIQLELLSRKAASMNLQDSQDFTLQVHNLKKNLLAQALLKDFEENSPISESDIQAEYESAKAEFQVPQIKGSHILLKTKEEAMAVIAQLKKKADFAELAKEKSTGPSGPNGGDLGWFSPAQMVKPFSDAIIAMEKGAFSQEPTQTQFGWHVIKKEDERIGEAPALDNLRPRIEQQLKQKNLEAYIEKIRSELAVEELFGAKAPTPKPVVEEKAPETPVTE